MKKMRLAIIICLFRDFFKRCCILNCSKTLVVCEFEASQTATFKWTFWSFLSFPVLVLAFATRA